MGSPQGGFQSRYRPKINLLFFGFAALNRRQYTDCTSPPPVEVNVQLNKESNFLLINVYKHPLPPKKKLLVGTEKLCQTREKMTFYCDDVCNCYVLSPISRSAPIISVCMLFGNQIRAEYEISVVTQRCVAPL